MRLFVWRWVVRCFVQGALLSLLASCVTFRADAQIKGPIAKRKAPQQARRAQILERFSQLPPAEQDRLLERLPTERRKQARDNLDRYRELTPEQKERLAQQYENFQQWPPEKQQTARRIFRQMNALDPERRAVLRREIARLRNLPREQRLDRINHEEFQSAYSSEEVAILKDLANLMPEPAAP